MHAGRLVAGIAVVVGTVTPVVAVGGGVARAATTADVTTAAYNNLRDNWDPGEPGLSPSAVTSAGFGQLFSTPVVGQIYAQPLVVNGTVLVTTEAARAYGINATTGAVEWSRNFGSPFLSSTIGCSDLTPDIGSTSTPVVDPATGLAYLTTRLETGAGGLANAAWYLQAIHVSTGAEAAGFPLEISGTPYDTPGVPFNDSYEMQRPGLLLLGGVVYMAFASDCDFTPYRGIVVGVSTTTHAITTMWSDESGVGTDQNSQAGIWQSGAGLVSTAPDRIVLTTGNGVSPQPAPSDQPPPTLSESVVTLKVGSKGKLTPIDFFSPSDAANLDARDEDLGSGGPIALPSPYFGTTAIPDLIVQQGKDGRVFLINGNDMGGFQQGSGGTDDVLQTVGPFEGEWGHPAAYGGQGGWVYLLESGGGPLRALSYGVNGQGLPQLASAGVSADSFGYTSGAPLVTSNGTKAGSAVVWVVYSSGSSGAGGTLLAYDAVPTGGVMTQIWSAPIGTATKFTVPTASDGRIYVGTRDGNLLAFGSNAAAPLQAPSVDLGSVPVGTTVTTTVPASTPQGLTITGPVTVHGYQGLTGPVAVIPTTGSAPSTSTTTTSPPPPTTTTTTTVAPGSGAGTSTTATTSGGRTATTGPATTAPASTTATGPGASGATAGPTTPPPPRTAPIATSVLTVHQPPVGTVFGPGAAVPITVSFTPSVPGPVVATLSVPTSAGTESISVSGYGTAPGLVLSSQPLAFGTIDTGVRWQAADHHLHQLVEPPRDHHRLRPARPPLPGRRAAGRRDGAGPPADGDRLGPVQPGGRRLVPVAPEHLDHGGIGRAPGHRQRGHRCGPPVSQRDHHRRR